MDKPERKELKVGYYQPDSNGLTIYIGNLVYEKTQYDIKALFEEYGNVKYVKINVDPETNRSKGFGFVQMSNKSDGYKAIKTLNGKQLDGRTLKVSEAKELENPKWKAPDYKKAVKEIEEEEKKMPRRRDKKRGLDILLDFKNKK
jgi:RNA recognition motif-containing protein